MEPEISKCAYCDRDYVGDGGFYYDYYNVQVPSCEECTADLVQMSLTFDHLRPLEVGAKFARQFLGRIKNKNKLQSLITRCPECKNLASRIKDNRIGFHRKLHSDDVCHNSGGRITERK